MEDRFKYRIWVVKERRYIYSDKIHDMHYPGQAGENFEEEGYNSHRYFPKEPKEYEQEQCLGRRDKNGKLIYEGDTDGKFIVEWWNTGFGAREIKTGNIYPFSIEGFEVVGNIHENGDLMEVEG